MSSVARISAPADDFMDAIRECLWNGALSPDDVVSMLVKTRGEPWIKRHVADKWRLVVRHYAQLLRGSTFRQSLCAIRSDDAEFSATLALLKQAKWISADFGPKPFGAWTAEDLRANEAYYRGLGKSSLRKAAMIAKIRRKVERKKAGTVGEALTPEELKAAIVELSE